MPIEHNSPLDDLEASQQRVLTSHAADLLKQQAKTLLWVQAAMLIPMIATGFASLIYFSALFIGHESRFMMFFLFLFSFVLCWRLLRVLGAFQKYKESTEFSFASLSLLKIAQTRKLLWENICVFWLVLAIFGSMLMGAQSGGSRSPNFNFQELINSNTGVNDAIQTEEIIAPALIQPVDAFDKRSSSDSSLLKLLQSITTKNNK